MYYCARDSFRRLLDLSTCIEAVVECLDVVIVPPTSLEEMILKEHSSEKLTLYTPPLPSLWQGTNNSAWCSNPVYFSKLLPDEDIIRVNDQIYAATKMFEGLKLSDMDDEVEIDLKFHCSSRFILLVCYMKWGGGWESPFSIYLSIDFLLSLCILLQSTHYKAFHFLPFRLSLPLILNQEKQSD